LSLLGRKEEVAADARRGFMRGLDCEPEGAPHKISGSFIFGPLSFRRVIFARRIGTDQGDPNGVGEHIFVPPFRHEHKLRLYRDPADT